MSIEQLPDELLAACLRLVPAEEPARWRNLLCFSSRAGVEQVCHRWRRLALHQLPWSACLNLCALHRAHVGFQGVAPALEAAVQRLAGRQVTDLSILGCGVPFQNRMHTISPALWPTRVILAARVFTKQHRLYLDGSSLLLFTHSLGFCHRLESLTVWLPVEFDGESEDTLAEHISRLPHPLQQLSVGRASAELLWHLSLVASEHQVQAATVRGAPRGYDCPWNEEEAEGVECSLCLRVRSQRQADMLSAGLHCLPLLDSLSIIDVRQPSPSQPPTTHSNSQQPPPAATADLNKQPLSVPYLPQLEELSHLRCTGPGSVPPEIWSCACLERLVCSNAHFPAIPRATLALAPEVADRLASFLQSLRAQQIAVVGAGVAAAAARVAEEAAEAEVQFCSSLRSLQLEGCSFADDAGQAVPHVLLAALTQLTRLSLSNPPSVSGLPAAITSLSALRALRLHGNWLGRRGVEPLTSLTTLTALFLPNCRLTKLPPGPYLSRLQVLDISGNEFGQPLPFEATAAAQLHTLCISAPGPQGGDEMSFTQEILGPQHWEGLEDKLKFFRKLKALVLVVPEWLEVHDWAKGGPPGREEVDALESLIDERFEDYFCTWVKGVALAGYVDEMNMGVNYEDWDVGADSDEEDG